MKNNFYNKPIENVYSKAFIKSGGSIEAIKAKYDIPADVLKTL